MAARRTNGQVWERIGELTTNVENLKETIDRNYVESKESDANILLAVKDLKIELTDWIDKHQSELFKSINNHSEYHKTDEEKWGPAKYIKNHIKQTVITAI